jgi:molybdopterin synthase catalytic subunit
MLPRPVTVVDVDPMCSPAIISAAVDPAGTPGRVVLAEVRDSPLSVDECMAAVLLPDVGGIALFVGAVRDHDHGRHVTDLAYEAHPRAAVEIGRIAAEVAREGAVRAIAVTHRAGHLRVGELAVVVAVGAAHRAEAFAACRRLIDDIKAQVPIWKHQIFADGAAEWVGAC